MKFGMGIPSLTDIRLFGPEMREDPYPVYRDLRAKDPVHWDPALGAWVLTSHRDVMEVLHDPRFSSDRVSRARARFPDERLKPLFDTLGLLMLQRDNPDHLRLRSLVNRAFLRASVERWEAVVQRRIDFLLNGARDAEIFEFVGQFAVPLPLLVISEVMGIPEEDSQAVRAWCDKFSVVALNFYTHVTDRQLAEGCESALAFRAYLGERLEEFRRSPRQNLLSSLVQVESAGERLSLDELLANAMLLLNAGNETTTNLLGNGLVALIQHPPQLQKLRADPTLMPVAIEEMLRYDSPVQFIGRIAREDVCVRGRTIRQGDLVLVVLAAANRDPCVFEQPEVFDIERQSHQHVAFGHGPHYCVGAPLARLEARLAFASILKRWSGLKLAGEELRRHENFNLRRFHRVPLEFEIAQKSS